MAIDPNGDTTYVGYDENGNVISAVDRLGNEASFGYDSLNLPTFQEVEGATTYLWVDPDGLKSAAWNAVSADTTVFDAAGRPVKQIVRRGTNLSRRYVIESAYDDDGPRNRLWVSAPGSIDYNMRAVWNDEGRIERLSNHVPTTPIHTDFLYNDHFQLDTVKIGGSTRWTYGYSSFHPPTTVNYAGAVDAELSSYVWRDPERLHVLSAVRNDTVRKYTYDELGQVTAVADSLRQHDEPDCFIDPQYGYWCNPGSWFLTHLDSASFAYDAVGNRTDSGAGTDTGNRLTELGDYSFTHDDEGRTRTKNKTGLSQTFYWNARGQLDSVKISELVGEIWHLGTVRYTYDGLGRRISREGPGGFEEYLYDGPHVIAILDDEQDVVSTLSYYPGVDRPHSLMTSSETYYYATDHTGSVSGLVDYSGTPDAVNTYRYDVWGKPQVATEAVPNPLRFKARLWDEDTGLADFRARWYDPDIGRFISEDPIGLAGGINVYRFVGNDPVSGWDPFGLNDPDDCPTSGEGGYWTEDADGNPVFVLEPLGVCAEQGSGDPGPGPPMPAGPSGFPLPPGGNRSFPGGGGGGTTAGQLNAQYRNACLVDGGLFVAEAALDAVGAGAVNAVGVARVAARASGTGLRVTAGESLGLAAHYTKNTAAPGLALGTVINPGAADALPGTNFASLGANSGSTALSVIGRGLEGARALPFAGTVVQGLAAGLSCGRWALFAALR